MKKFSKAIIAFAAVASLSAAMAVCASAANELTATYDATAGTVAISGFTVQDQNTMVVLSGDDVTIAAENIKAIDQQTGSADVYSAVAVGTLEDGTYTVKVGGTAGTIEVGTFTVGGTEEGLRGDANDDSKVDGTDAVAVVDYALGYDQDNWNATNADANLDNKIDGLDAVAIVDYVSTGVWEES